MNNERGSLRAIELRHGRDHVRDGIFVLATLLMALLSLGAMSSKAEGSAEPRHFEGTVTVIESNLEIGP